METAFSLLNLTRPAWPTAATVVLFVVVLFAARAAIDRRVQRGTTRRFGRQIVMVALWGVGLLAIVMVLPVSDTMRGQILSLVGIVLSAAIALSSTTIVGNAMAGIMLRVLHNFRTGDFIQVGDHFGRVSERGLFHTEIQTEDSDLTTLPNLFLVTNPTTVIRESGTLVSATVSLGYDASWMRVESLLCEAATKAGLETPFVQVQELGDFSVTYRVAGRLAEIVKRREEEEAEN